MSYSPREPGWLWSGRKRRINQDRKFREKNRVCRDWLFQVEFWVIKWVVMLRWRRWRRTVGSRKCEKNKAEPWRERRERSRVRTIKHIMWIASWWLFIFYIRLVGRVLSFLDVRQAVIQDVVLIQKVEFIHTPLTVRITVAAGTLDAYPELLGLTTVMIQPEIGLVN